MRFCEIITDFKITDFEILKKTIDLDKALLITDNLAIQQKIQELGYNVIEMRQYFGHVSPKLYSIYNEAIRKMKDLKQFLSGIKYDNIGIVEGLNVNFLEQLIFLGKIKHLLEEKRNIVFLFSNISFLHFSILELLSHTKHQNKFGVAIISGSEIKLQKFNDIFLTNIGLYYDIEKAVISQSYSDFIPEANIVIDEPNPECIFFLTNNDEDFYLKPIYPILENFSKKQIKHLIFTFSGRTKQQLLNRKIKVVDLVDYFNSLEIGILHKNKKIISEFFHKINNFPTNDPVVKAYLKYFVNDRIGRDIAGTLTVIVIISDILQKTKPKSVFVGADGVSENDIACEIAKNLGILTFSTPSGMTEYNPIYGALFHAAHLLLSGPRLKSELEELGIESKRLIVIGNPRFDYINKNTEGKILNAFGNRNQEKKMIIVAMSRMHENDEVWMSQLIHYCNDKNFHILIKLHPLYKFNPDQNEICEQKIAKINESCTGLEYKISYDDDLTKSLPLCDVLITEYSLVGIEATLQQKPVIIFNPTNEKYYKYSLQFHKEKIALYSSTIGELFKGIDKVLNDKKTQEDLQKGREKFNFKFNYLNDGKASERITQILTTDQKNKL